MLQSTTPPPSAGGSEDAYKLLNDSLYVGAGSLVTGAAFTAVIAALCGYITHSLAPIEIAAAASALATVRISIAMRRRLHRLNWHDAAYSGFAAAYLACSGALTFWGYVFTNEPVVLALTLIVSLVNAMGIGLRSFAIEKVVRLHILAALVPVTAGFLVRGGYFYIAALTQVILILYIYSSAGRLRAILLSEIGYRRRSDTVAKRFRFAIDNMSHGMAMIDSSMRIVVSNAELGGMFRRAGGPAAARACGSTLCCAWRGVWAR